MFEPGVGPGRFRFRLGGSAVEGEGVVFFAEFGDEAFEPPGGGGGGEAVVPSRLMRHEIELPAPSFNTWMATKSSWRFRPPIIKFT